MHDPSGEPSAQSASSMLVGSTAAMLADHHADLLALAWRRRPQLLLNPLMDFADLETADDRLLASIDALATLGAPARSNLQDRLKEPLRPEDMFVIALFALATRDESLFEACMAIQAVLPDLGSPLIDAFRWAPASSMLRSYLERFPLATRLQLVGDRYRDFSGLVSRVLEAMKAVNEPGEGEILSALDAVSFFGKVELAVAALSYLEHRSEAVRFAAAETLLVFGPPNEARRALDTMSELARSGDAVMAESVVRCLAVHAPDQVSEIASSLDGRASKRAQIQIFGWTGRPDGIPALVGYLDDPQLARLAGASLLLLTGSDPARDGWLASSQRRIEPEGGDDSMPAPDVDRALPWPNPEAFRTWWQKNEMRFDCSRRYILGRPIEEGWLAQVIRRGPLPWRGLAAEHRHRLAKSALFPVHLPARAQRAIFSELDRKLTS